MSLVINHNLMAMNAARNLSQSYSDLGVSTRRLSSGLRVGAAADDAAGLAVRELMRSDIASLNQGIRNANDAISLIQTADGALGVIDEKLIRMKELATQAATGTYSSEQRIIIDSEYQAMASEITRIANATDFNGIYLLNGNLSGATHSGATMNPTGKLKVHFGTGNLSAEDYYYIQIGSCTASSLGFRSGVSTAATGKTESQFVSDNNLTLLGSSTWGNVLTGGTYNNIPNPPSGLISSGSSVNIYRIPSDMNRVIIGKGTNNDIVATWFTTGPGGTWNYYSAAGYEIVGNAGSSPSSASISTQELAQKALDVINKAIVSKDKIRANLGALQNRLENTVQNLSIQAENLQAAESQISDVDVAEEMTSFVRSQILTQSAIAMLSQANSLPKMALQLLG